MGIDLNQVGDNFTRFQIKANPDATPNTWVAIAVTKSKDSEGLYTMGWLDVLKTRQDDGDLHFLDLETVEEATGLNFDKFDAHTRVDADGEFAVPLLYEVSADQVEKLALVSYAWAHKKTAEDFIKLSVDQATPRPENIVSIADRFTVKHSEDEPTHDG